MLLLLVIKAIPVKVFGKWGSAVAEAMAGQGGEENLFQKGFFPTKQFCNTIKYLYMKKLSCAGDLASGNDSAAGIAVNDPIAFFLA